MTADKVDGNQREILQALTDIGAVYRVMARKTGFDVLIGFRGQCYLVEIKDGSLPPSRRQLTTNEAKTRAAFARVDVEIHICKSLAEVLQVIGAA